MKPVINSTHLAAQAYATQARSAQAGASRAPGRASGGVPVQTPAGRQAPSVRIEISAEALNAARLDTARLDTGARQRLLADARGQKPDPGRAAQPASGPGVFVPVLLAGGPDDADMGIGRGVGRREAPLAGLRAAEGGLAQDSRPGRLIDIRV